MPKGVYTRKNKLSDEELSKRYKLRQKIYRDDPYHKKKAAEEIKKYALTQKRIVYRKNYRDSRREYEKNFRQEKKRILFDTMGGKCKYCGFSDYRALQIDHVRGDGFQDKKEQITNGNPYFNKVLDSFIKNEGKYQLLCANCNWIKRFENNEHCKR